MSKKIFSKVIYTNDAVNICYEASKSCYASPLSYDEETRERYIAARVREGHSSITEHSNIIYLLRIPKKQADALVEFLSGCLFLHTCLKQTDNNFYLLIGGSALAFNHTIANMQNQFNAVLAEIKNLIYESVPVCFFENLTNTHMMQKARFLEKGTTSIYHMKKVANVETYGKESLYSYRHTIESLDVSRIKFINVDPIEDIYNAVKDYGFNMLDIMEFCSITIKFKGMSRIITQQLTRHRNAITQESQRYVDSTNAGFNNPVLFKPDEYDPTKPYRVKLGDQDLHLTLDELGTIMNSVYHQLLTQELKKEDARAYLPGNTRSNLYVTFTFKNLFHFLKLRLDTHAQAEIRLYANIIAESLFTTEPYKSIFEVNIESWKDDVIQTIEEYLMPKAMYSEMYGKDDIKDNNEEAIGDPVKSVEEVNATAEPAVGEELPNFGMEGSVPQSSKDLDAEEIYKQYNPEQYASTRDEKKN